MQDDAGQPCLKGSGISQMVELLIDREERFLDDVVHLVRPNDSEGGLAG